MAITAAQFTASFAWAMEKANTGFEKTLQGDDQIRVAISPDVSIFTVAYLTQLNLAAAATQTIDFFAAITDFVGNSVSPTKVCGIIVAPAGSSLKLEPGASNPLSWFLSGTTPAITIPDGGVQLFAQPTAQTVSSGARNLKFTNTGGASLTALVGLLLGP